MAVFGGGIAGLTVAHECAEAGFEVTIYERGDRIGGKTIGYIRDDGLPTEHSLRGFPVSYTALFESMRRIPYGKDGASTFDNLVPLESYLLVSVGEKRKDSEVRLLRRSRWSWVGNLLSPYRAMRRWDVPMSDAAALGWGVLRYMLSGERRRRDRIFHQSISEYLRMDRRSKAFRDFVDAFIGSITAARLDASAEAMLNMLVIGITHPAAPVDDEALHADSNAMNGPTNERLLEPWADAIRALGGEVVCSAEALELNTEVKDNRARVTSVTVQQEDGVSQVTADAYVLATQHDAVRRLWPSILGEHERRIDEEWTAGFQIYLKSVPERLRQKPLVVFAFDSPWQIVYYVEQPPLWKDVPLPDGVKAVLSLAVSSFEDRPGLLYGKPFLQCTREEAYQEILAQLGIRDSADECVHEAGMAVGPLVEYVDEPTLAKSAARYRDWDQGPLLADGHRWVTSGTLHVKKAGRRDITVDTDLDNLYVAGEFVDTPFIKFPSMEKACEAGKLCSALLCERFGLPYDQGRLEFPEPLFGWVRRLDDRLYGTWVWWALLSFVLAGVVVVIVAALLLLG